MKLKYTILSLATLAAAWTVIAAEAPPPAVPFTVEGLCQSVQPMKHSLKGRLPLFLWWMPEIPGDQPAVQWRQDGRMRKAVDELGRRGIAVLPVLSEPSIDGAIATALTIQEAGQPVYVMKQTGVCFQPVIGNTLFAHAPTYKAPAAWNAAGEPEGTNTCDWIAMTRYDVKPTVAMYQEWMQRLKKERITLAGLWCDYEGLPNPWNFAYQAAKTPAGRGYYPAESLTSFAAFEAYIINLNSQVLSEGIVDPVHAVFPEALVGNYGNVPSSAAYPCIDGNLAAYVPLGIGRLNVSMPSVYADNIMLKRFFNADWEVTQADADNIYFTIMLQQLSSACANKTPGQKILPFVANLVYDDTGPRFRFGLSPDLYRELHRHALLRGVDGFYVFTTQGYYGRTVAEIFAMVENTRAPYDEMLEYREFLDRGIPMNFEVPAIRTKGLIWSGLRLKDRCLVRAFTMGPGLRRLDFVPFPGVAVSVDAPPTGATYLIDKRGRVQKLGAGL